VGAAQLVITSPGWPEVYGDNELCEWWIQANTTGYRLELEFTNFSVEFAFDYVDVSFSLFYDW